MIADENFTLQCFSVYSTASFGKFFIKNMHFKLNFQILTIISFTNFVLSMPMFILQLHGRFLPAFTRLIVAVSQIRFINFVKFGLTFVFRFFQAQLHDVYWMSTISDLDDLFF